MSSVKYRLIALLSAMGLLVGISTIAFTGSTGAALQLNLLATSTTVSASPNVVVSSSPSAGFVPQSTTLAVAVTLAPLGGLLVSPSGSVTFTAVDGEGDTIQLGSAKVSTCLLTLIKCNADLSTNAFYVTTADQNSGLDGTKWTVTASYPGDLVAKPSTGFTTVWATTGNSMLCDTSDFCEVDATNGDGSASIDLSQDCLVNCDEESAVHGAALHGDALHGNAVTPAATGSTSYTVWAGFGAPQMGSCPNGNTPLDPAGDSQNAYVNFPPGATSFTNSEDITYTLYGATADAQNGEPFCYSQSTPFTQTDGSTSPFNATLGDYEGYPPVCASETSPEPCTNPPVFTSGSPDTWSISVFADTDPGIGKH
jgi:hypothetical protein